ncbi:MAG: GAF domain-containing protein, partial [Anaerolineae bacterium]|nr:GAF domain-containing protein [Anaerolineae bacterium]
MDEINTSNLSHRITRWRWQAPMLALLLVLAHQLVEHIWLIHLPTWQHFATQVLFYGLIGPTLTWWALTSLRRTVVEAEAAEQALHNAHTTLTEVNKQLSFLLRVNRRLAEAEDEETLNDTILRLPLEIVPAVGCTFVRFDQHQMPLLPLHHGNLDPLLSETWAAQMTDARKRKQCKCHACDPVATVTLCPLFRDIKDTIEVGEAHCLKLIRGDRTFGVLIIYLRIGRSLTMDERALLEATAQEISLALESQALRARELAMLARLQQASRLKNLNEKLENMLVYTVDALEAAGGTLFVINPETTDLKILAQTGQQVEAEFPRAWMVDVRQTKTPIIRRLEADNQAWSLLITSLRAENKVLGGMALWTVQPELFTPRRMQLMDIVAGQAALLIDNYQLGVLGEHRAALSERARLAREIHDGLAQTLGYLKLRTAQITRWLDSGNRHDAVNGLIEVRQLLNEAYMDAREAIDGLHLKADPADLQAWLGEIISEFERSSGIAVTTTLPEEISLPLEVHLQFQRIIQEALSNIRKHAQATSVRLVWQITDGCLTLQISDNGFGFDVDDIMPENRHGLY